MLGYDFHELKSNSDKFGPLNVNFSELTSSNATLQADFSAQKIELEASKKLVATLETAKLDADFSALSKRGMVEGKLTKEYAEGDFRELFNKMGADFASKHLDAMPKSIATDFSGSSEEKKTTGEKNAAEQILEETKAIQLEKDCDFSKATDILLAAKPELFAAADLLAED